MKKKFNIEVIDQVLVKKGVEATIDFYHVIAIDEFKISGVHAFVTGVDSTFLNVAIDTRDNTKNSYELIIAVEKFFKRYSMPWAWFISATAKSNDLEKFGFSLLEESPGMYFNLEHSLPNDTLENLSIEEVEIKEDLLKWIQPIAESFGSTDNGERYRKLNANLLKKGEKKLRHFVAYYRNEIAGAATLFLSHESVMLQNLATKMAFRKRGIGTALTLYLMEKAQRMGYKHCFLDSSEAGFNLYERLGFQVYCTTLAYCKN